MTKAHFRKFALHDIQYIRAYKAVQREANGNAQFIINPEMLPKVEQMIGNFKCHWSAFDF